MRNNVPILGSNHGLNIMPVDGVGVLPIDGLNAAYNCDNWYDPHWIQPHSQRPLMSAKSASAADGADVNLMCLCCGWRFKEGDVYFFSSIHTTMKIHYPCRLSALMDYDLCRFEACLCRQTPPLLSWAVSRNDGHHMPPGNDPLTWTRWTYMEVVDMLVALKLSGNFPVGPPYPPHLPPGAWVTALQYAPILRSTGKTIAQVELSWTNQRQHIPRLMTAAFLNAVVLPGINHHMP